MNRGRTRRWLAAVAAACAAPAFAQSAPPTPVLSIEQVTSPRLLGAFDLANMSAANGPTDSRADQNYRLDPPPGGTTGKRARLSVALGKSTLFAIAGRVKPNRGRLAPELTAGAPRQPGGGKTYGAGIERRIGAFELGAVYQYSKANAGEAEAANAPRLGGDKSHNLRATLRVRFRP